ncbi:WD40-repeat-containing domain protein [Aspergillus pseudodeflectus]|uniref:WD40-repeat-containing domain protein n=1 Tax=Aspergillus pseudodeflectus TaxID=176178 RepID=A0ABR4K5V7_9EURO
MPEVRQLGTEPVCLASTRSQDTQPHCQDQASSVRRLDRGIKPADTRGDVSAATDFTHFKSVKWSPDGTTLLTDSSDHNIRTYILPPDLLDEESLPHKLSHYSILSSGEPTYATAFYPFFSLQEPSSAIFLSSVRDHPIRLTSALAPMSLATYSLVNPMTEAFITPHSMIYPPSLGGTHFLTGSDSLICLFDVSRPGNEGPVSWMPTIPSKRKQLVGGGIGMKGIISAMALNPDQGGILAAGTFSRNVGLYDSNGSGQSLGTFSVSRTEADRHIGGGGVTQLLWSPCGRYLYIAERKSDGVLVYDIRVTGQLLGWLQGRRALTNQRMEIDLVSTAQGSSHEIWAGGTDGFMRLWQDPAYTAGGQDPGWEWRVNLSNDSVSSTVMHPSGDIAATTSGQKRLEDHAIDGSDESNRNEPNPLLDVWLLPRLNGAQD